MNQENLLLRILDQQHGVDVKASLEKNELQHNVPSLKKLCEIADDAVAGNTISHRLVYNGPTTTGLAMQLAQYMHRSKQDGVKGTEITKIPERCRRVLERTDFGAEVNKTSAKRLRQGSSSMDVYRALKAASHVLTQLGINANAKFGVIDLLNLDFENPPSKFTPLVWTTLDACLIELVDMSLFVPGDTKKTMGNVLALAQLDDKMCRLSLLHQMWNHAQSQGVQVSGWEEAQKYCEAFQLSGDIFSAIHRQQIEEIAELEERAIRGEEINWDTVKAVKTRQSRRHGAGRSPHAEDPEVTRLKAENSRLRAEAARLKRAGTTGTQRNTHSINALVKTNERCSRGVCNFAHGSLPCPFENQICRVCMEPYDAEHPAYGRCTRVKHQVRTYTLDGQTYRRVKLQGGDSQTKGKGQERDLMPQLNVASRLRNLERRVESNRVGNINHKNILSQAPVPPSPVGHPANPIKPTNEIDGAAAVTDPSVVSENASEVSVLSAASENKSADPDDRTCSESTHRMCMVDASNVDVELEPTAPGRPIDPTADCVAPLIPSEVANLERTRDGGRGQRLKVSESSTNDSRINQTCKGDSLPALPTGPGGTIKWLPAKRYSGPQEVVTSDESPVPPSILRAKPKHRVSRPCPQNHLKATIRDSQEKRARKEDNKWFNRWFNANRGKKKLHELPGQRPLVPERSNLNPNASTVCAHGRAACTSCDHGLPELHSVQSPNARAQMWQLRSDVSSSSMRNWRSKADATNPTGFGRVKFYTTSRGRGSSSKAQVPWGFIEPLDDGEPDVHFTMFALQNIPEDLVEANVAVEYSIVPGTNTAEWVNMVSLSPEEDSATTDSGAFISATAKQKNLHNYRKLAVPIPVGTANGTTLFLVGIGDLHVRRDGKLLIFRNIFHAPGCASTLLSVRMLTKHGGWTLYADDKVTKLTHRVTGEVIQLDDSFRFPYSYSRSSSSTTQEKVLSPEEVASIPGLEFANRQGLSVQMINALDTHDSDLLSIHNPSEPHIAYFREGVMEFCPISEKRNISYCTWHRRLGHQSCNYIKKFALAQGIKLHGDIPGDVCETCVISKMQQQLSRNPRPRADNFLDRVHADTIGPIKPIGRDGSKYALVVVDCCTRAPYVYPQASNDSATTFQSLNRFCANVGGSRPKEVYADGGSEFKGSVKQWCDKHGIRVRLSPPYAHHLNGVVERKVRSLKEMARCILNDSKLPHTFWPYAFSYAAYILMRSGTTALPNWSSPYSLIHGKQPNHELLKVFGSKVVFHSGITRPTGSSKALSNPGREGIFLGIDETYPTGTATIFDTETHKIIHANNVVYFEDKNVVDTKAWEQFSDPNFEDEEFHIDEDYIPDDTDTDSDSDYEDESDDETESDDEDHGRSGSGETIEEANGRIVSNRNASDPNKPPVPNQVLLPPTRSGRKRRPPDRYDPRHEAERPQLMRHKYLKSVSNMFLLNGVLKDPSIRPTLPKSDKDAMSDPLFGKRWKEAKERELAQFVRYRAFTEVDRDDVPIGAQIIPTHFIRTIKTSGKFKYRLVAAGNIQLGTTAYAPTAALTSLRMVAAQCTANGYPLRQADVSAAFLQSPIDDEVYVERPPQTKIPTSEYRKKVWRLNKAMYGLRKSPRYWYKTVSAAMEEFGLKPSDTDACVYHKSGLLVGIWVDDFLYGGTDANIKAFEQYLLGKFGCDQPEDAHLFCGITIRQSIINGRRCVTLDQARLVEELMHEYDINPQVCESPIVEYQMPKAQLNGVDESVPYRPLLGSLMYVMIATRPDIAFAIHHFSRFSQKYDSDMFISLQRVLQYLHHTREKRITYWEQHTPRLEAYTDANWAGCPQTRKSTSGRVVFYGGSPVSWCSQLQRAVSTSSFESELYALTDTIKEVVYLRIFLDDIGRRLQDPTVIYCDNKATVQVCIGRDNNLKRLRHLRDLKRFLDIRRQFIQTQLQEVRVVHCSADSMLADLLTKPLGPKKTSRCVRRILHQGSLHGPDASGLSLSTCSSAAAC